MEVMDFLINLKAVSGSPYAFAAYIALVAAWIYVVVARHRLGVIAQLLKDLPTEDRTQVILKEYSTTPRSGLSAEQWIRSRRTTLVFLASLAFMVCMTIIVIIALTIDTTPPEKKTADSVSGPVLSMLQTQNERILELEKRLYAAENRGNQLKDELVLLSKSEPNAGLVELMRNLNHKYEPADPVAEALFADTTLSNADKVSRATVLLIQKIDQDIQSQAKRVDAESSAPSIDVETMKLKRLIDRRSQLFDLLRQDIDRYNLNAKAIIDSMGR